jgi:N-acetylmuramoyl-L-alanine amidase
VEAHVKLKGTVVIDPGHGGTAKIGGSSANNATSFSGVLEKTMTLDFALLVRYTLLAANSDNTDVRVMLTRTADVNLGLAARANVARDNRADIFLSIHFNAFNKQTRGVETLVRPIADGNVNHDEDVALAKRIQNAVFSVIAKHDPSTKDRGVKDQTLGVLIDSQLGNTNGHHPCRSCLLEIEFIDVEVVDRLLNTGPDAARVRKEIATAIKNAIHEDLRSHQT